MPADRRAIALAASIGVAACAGEPARNHATRGAEPCILQASDSPPGRAEFLREVLDARATRRTRDFRSMSRSYQPTKSDLAAELPKAASACGLPLAGAVVIGPSGGLWTYRVIAFVGDSAGHVRVNQLIMPHGRITYKASGLAPESMAAEALDAFGRSPLLSPGAIPSAARAEADPIGREFSYDVMVVRRDGDSIAVWSGATTEASERAADSAAVSALFARLDSLLARTRRTYEHGDSVSP